MASGAHPDRLVGGRVQALAGGEDVVRVGARAIRGDGRVRAVRVDRVCSHILA